MGANVIVKDIMAHFNVIDGQYTKLILKFPFAISRYMTKRLSNEPSFSKDSHFRDTLRCIAAANMNEEEIIAKAVKALIFRGDKRRQLSDQKRLLKGSASGIGLCNSIHEGIKSEMVSNYREWAKKKTKEKTNALIASEGTFLDKFADDDWSD
jgi:hypothetical protein